MVSAAPRVELPFERWPADDRRVWEVLFIGDDPLEDAGEGRHWASSTRTTNRRHYARWLAWLSAESMLEAVSRPWERATQPVIRRYADHLVAKVAPQTAASVLIGLKVVLKAMHPAGNWRWLMDVSNRLNAWAEPSVDRSAQTVPIERIHNACLSKLDRLELTPLVRRIERVAYRDTLIVLVLSAAPIRLRNLAMIEIGHHLEIGDRSATLRFREGETKNRQALKYTLPLHVLPYIVSYLERIRPTFRPRDGCTRLWLGFEGQPLTDHSIYGRITLVTKRLLDVAINPHSFRTCVATSLAERSSTDARLAAPLLGHRYFATTERHYIRARQLEATRSIHATLVATRRNPDRKGPQ